MIPKDENRVAARCLGMVLTVALTLNPSYALAFQQLNPSLCPKAELFTSEAVVQAGLSWLSPSFARKASLLRLKQESEALDSVDLPDSLKEYHRMRVQLVSWKFNLSEADQMYLAELWRQRLYPNVDKKPLKIGRKAAKGENFILASELTEEQRRDWLGTIPYKDVVKDPANSFFAQNIIITMNSLDGGIGENVGRLEWLKNRLRAINADADVSHVKMGAKGTDLGYDIVVKGHPEFVSIAEARILQLVQTAQEKKFARIYLQPLVNDQSRHSYETLFNSFYLFDRADPSIPDARKRTYRQIFEEVGIAFHPSEEMLMQSDLPGIEADSGLISMDDDGLRQPGGHGQWGVALLWDAYRTALPKDNHRHVRVFSNGDNVNSRASPDIAGYMIRHRIPILKLTTPATPVDKKGGKDGVRLVPVNQHIEYVPDQMELADAKSSGQVQAFYDAGQSGDPAKLQPFNTNIIYLNLSLLHPILNELKDVVGENMLARAISPALIAKDPKEKNGKNYIPFDGAVGVSIHNLNAFFQTSTDPRVKAILQKYHVDRLLRFVDVPRDFFAPVKSTFDIWWQRDSDVYRFDQRRMGLETVDKNSFVTPQIDLSSPRADDPKKDDGFWNELQNLVNAFGHAGTQHLRSLVIKGQVLLHDAVLIGDVSIISPPGHLVDVRPYFSSIGGLVLKNISLVFEVHDSRIVLLTHAA